MWLVFASWVISYTNEWVEHSNNWGTTHFWQCLGTVLAPLVVSFSLQTEDQGLVEFYLSSDFNWFLLCPWAMSFFQKLGPAPFTAIPCSFPEPVLGPQCCLYNLLEGQLENSRPLGEKYCNDIQSFLRFRPSSSMFSTTCVTTEPLIGPARVGDRHTKPARSPSVGAILSRATELPGTMFATLGVSPAGHLDQSPYNPYPKATNISLDQISTPLLWNI